MPVRGAPSTAEPKAITLSNLMRNRHHTVVVVSPGQARYFKLRLTTLQVALTVGAAGLVTVAALAAGWSYFQDRPERLEVERIVTENSGLQLTNTRLESEIRSLGFRLAGYEARTRELAIVAGLDGMAIDGSGGLGGADADGTTSSAAGNETARLDRLDETLNRVEGRIEERLLWVSSTPSILPCEGLLSSGFGFRADPVVGGRRFHRGLDISTSPGQPVRATADGTVLRSGNQGGLGRAVSLSHGFGRVTRYGHLADIEVGAGERVRRGDIIGHVGISGRSTGYHLHYEVLEEGRPVNPLAYLPSRPRS